MIVLLTGSRRITRPAAVAVHLRPLFDEGVLLVNGAGDGTDTVGDWWWKCEGGQTKQFPADWPSCGPECPPAPHRQVNRRAQEYCPLAGFRRNQEQVDWVAARLAEGIPARGLGLLASGRKNSGTRDCLKRAREAGIEMDEHPVEVA